MRTILINEIGKEKPNASALGAFNESISVSSSNSLDVGYSKEVIDKVNRSIELGTKVPREKLLEMFHKDEKNTIKKLKKLNSSKIQAKYDESKARVEAMKGTPNKLWGPGLKYSTQSEYQRSKLGSKWNW